LKIPEYYGIEKGYPRLRKWFGRLADYIVLLRPFTLLAPIFVGLFLTIAVYGLTFQSLTRGVYVGITLALAQACGQTINQIADVELDKIIKPYRPLPSGRVSREEALGIAFLLMLASVGRAFTISVYFGLMVCLMLFFAVFYSLPPFSPRKLNAWLNLLWMAIPRGFLPIIAIMGYEGLHYAILSFIWCFGWQGTKDIPDVGGDRKFGIKTIANTYGVKALLILSAISTAVYTVLVLWLGKYLLLVVALIGLYGLLNYNEKWKGENTVAWAVYYIGLGFIPLLIMFESLT
jgi:geranylgeranylglycerol-phosphate geranylgeranyltransferase